MYGYLDGLPIGVSFVVKNITSAPGRIIKVFNTQIYPGNTLDVMRVPGIGEDDIKEALLKGDLGLKIKNRQLQIVSSTIVITDSDPTFVAFLNSSGLTGNVVNNTTGSGGGATLKAIYTASSSTNQTFTGGHADITGVTLTKTFSGTKILIRADFASEVGKKKRKIVRSFSLSK